MYKFCFNDCIPKNAVKYDLVACLSNTLREYNSVLKKFPKDIEGIITANETNSILLNNDNFTLFDCISKLDHSTKRIAFNAFRKYPIEHNYENIDVDLLLAGEYVLHINNIKHNAINAKIVSINNGVLFSLGLHNDLRRNTLNIYDNQNDITIVNNLFGELANTEFIIQKINQSIVDKLGNYKKLLTLLDTCLVSDRFKNGFEGISAIMQVAIIDHFQSAIKRMGKTRFYPDGDLIKNVTPEKELSINLFELRLFKPVAYRIYFYEEGSKVYLASVERKPASKVQDNDIKSAISTIKQLMKTNI